MTVVLNVSGSLHLFRYPDRGGRLEVRSLTNEDQVPESGVDLAGLASVGDEVEEALLLARVDVGSEVGDTVLETVSLTLGGSGSGAEGKGAVISRVIEGNFEINVLVSSSNSVFEDLVVVSGDINRLFVPSTDKEESESNGEGSVNWEVVED